MAKQLVIWGLIINLLGVVTLFRYGMPYRVETKGQSMLLLKDEDLEAIKAEALYRKLGWLGLVLVIAGTALQIWAVF